MTKLSTSQADIGKKKVFKRVKFVQSKTKLLKLFSGKNA